MTKPMDENNLARSGTRRGYLGTGLRFQLSHRNLAFRKSRYIKKKNALDANAASSCARTRRFPRILKTTAWSGTTTIARVVASVRTNALWMP